MDAMTENSAPDEDRILPTITETTTPQQLVEEIAATDGMTAYGRVIVTDAEYDGAPVKRVELITGGWSDNEQLIEELKHTSFRFLWWSSSHRGGLHIYEVPSEQWTNSVMLFETATRDR
jgi:hypothetical protein